MLFLVVRETIQEVRAGGTHVIRDQERQHRALEDERRNGVGLGRFPAKGERSAFVLRETMAIRANLTRRPQRTQRKDRLRSDFVIFVTFV